MTKYEFKVRFYSNNTSLNGSVTTSERWETLCVYADKVEVTKHGALKFYDSERDTPDRLIAAEPPHAWCQLRVDR